MLREENHVSQYRLYDMQYIELVYNKTLKNSIYRKMLDVNFDRVNQVISNTKYEIS